MPEVDLYTSTGLAKYGVEIQNSVIMDRVDALSTAAEDPGLPGQYARARVRQSCLWV